MDGGGVGHGGLLGNPVSNGDGTTHARAEPETLLAADAVPDTLKVLLRRVASDYLPEIEAMIA
ncbi:MAG: hypothetical protein P8P20_05780, partial [Acidimicrobiales bacterium]|nr:hypothetical protein [Acidimicrobiales bacterium]